MRLKFLFILGALAFGFTTLMAQSVVSPYSSYGLGDITPISFSHNDGMGGIGIGSPQFFFINNQNPAWLSYNIYSTFQAGIKTDVRSYEAGGTNASDRSASLNYLSIAFPVMNGRWSTNLGLTPLSIVNYDITSTQSIDNTSDIANNEFQGNGGLTQLYWANGFRIAKGLNLGVRAAYNFGTLEQNVRNSVVRDSLLISIYKAEFQERSSYSDVTLILGLAHRIRLKNENSFNYGVTYRLGGTLTGTRDVNLRRLAANNTLIQDQRIVEDEEISADLPMEIGFGVSYQKSNKFLVGLDGRFTSWENVDGIGVNTRNTLSFGLGGSYTPDYKSVQNYLNRVIYRFGLSYNQLPYVINQTEINDFGINFGASFPISGSSSIDASFKFGTRGEDQNNLVRENYFQFVLGITFNDRWFIKRRYD